VPPLMRSRHGPGAAGHTGHCPQPAHTGLGSGPTVSQTAPVRSRSPPITHITYELINDDDDDDDVRT